MTRSEKIYKVASTYAIDEVKDTCNPASRRGLLYAGFFDGAVWADAHPDIDVRTMAAWQSGYNEGIAKSRWISVEDELPEVGVAVLTITPRGTQRVGFYEDGWWLANYIDLVRMGSITHWMPLPQAPHHFADVSQKVKKGDEE